MVKISLTEFVDFAIKSGPPKLTVVRQVKKRHADGYDPKTDFYRKLRDGIVGFHEQGHMPQSLDHLAASVTDRSKVKAYPELVAAYKRFLGRKKLEWFKPPRQTWSHGNLEVSVNPELGLEIDGEPHLIKLYFKGGAPSKLHLTTALHLMQLGLATKRNHRRIAVLDVRRGKLMPASSFDPMLTPLVEGEALAFASMYDAI